MTHILYTLFQLVSLKIRRYLSGLLFFIARALMTMAIWLLCNGKREHV